ncbi:MAG TPA: choice-of-anchor tandem repeat GloVer-containing protein [Candidatus Sulfotelmatobacter sp.]|nr:choice-of-anchor tandem repeat GloVer-containing protein [Candidatus Sulfotelmatobacter sp.]
MIKSQHQPKTLQTLVAFCVMTVITMSAQTFTTLAKFNGTNGGQPEFSLVQGSDGNFYGTTSTLGTSTGGTVFKMTPGGRVTVLYNFCSLTDCDDGAEPGQLLLASDGNAYGFTVTGGTNCHQLALIGCGTIFKLTPQKTLITLYSFCVQTNCTDGWNPDSLVLATDGNFYGTTFHGGPNGAGVAFKITPDGTFTVLYGFTGGQQPENLMQANDGNFYGTTYGCGIVFDLTPDGTVTTLHTFTANEGCTTHTGLIQASDGNFYGATAEGGAPHSRGTIYRLTTSGTLTRLHSFTCNQGSCPDGEIPVAPLLEGSDGNLYGTARGIIGGTQTNDGTIFKITTAGTFTTLHQFAYTNGAFPTAALIQAANGDFYGTTNLGGLAKCTQSCGTVFSLSVGLGQSRKP